MSALPALVDEPGSGPEYDDGDGGDQPINPFHLLSILGHALQKLKRRGPYFAAAVDAAITEARAEPWPQDTDRNRGNEK